MPRPALSELYDANGRPRPARETLPTMYDLPSEDPEDPGLPDDFHFHQPQLLRETFVVPGRDPEHLFVATDMSLYYDVRHPLHYKRPDWFAVIDTHPLYEERDLRLSYVIWQEGIAPFLVVELLSPGTEDEDLGRRGPRRAEQPPSKWEVYEQVLKVPYYIVYSRYEHRMRVFVLTGPRYAERTPEDGRFWLPELGIGIGTWQGTYAHLEREWLRFYGADGRWIPRPVEQEHARAELERRRADEERARADRSAAEAQAAAAEAERMRAKLLALGIDPDA